MKKIHVEMIEEYLVDEHDPGDFEYFDNHGSLIRCRECKHRSNSIPGGWCQWFGKSFADDFYCAEGEKDG